MDIDIVSVFPEYFDVLNLSLLGKAKSKGLISVHAHNLRDWTHDVHQSVDDTPVGGGAGMVMKPAVWAECLDELLGLPADAPAQTAGFMTMPAPPPTGVSSTDWCTSCVQSRRLCARTLMSPLLFALPSRLRSSTSKYSGKTETMSMSMAVL